MVTEFSKGTKENATMPDRNSAYTAIWQAVKDGKLKRGKCKVCGSAKTQAHHNGKYITTKNIEWLCSKHHKIRHVNLRKQRGEGYKKSVSELLDVEIIKSETKRLIYLVAAKPRELDTDQQWFELDDIELMAHRYLIRYTLGEAAIYEEHSKKLVNVFLVESYIAPVDFILSGREVRQGSWITVLWTPNDEIWNKVQTGVLRGASPRGPAKLFPDEKLTVAPTR